MKNIRFFGLLTFLLVLSILISRPYIVQAESDDSLEVETSPTPSPTATPSTSPREKRAEKIEEKREYRKEKMEERQENREERRDDRKEDRLAKKQEIIANFIAKMEKRVDAYYMRLTKISEKMQTRINKLKDDGKDVAEAQTQLDQAKKAIEDAKTNSLAVLKEMKEANLGEGKGIGSIISQAKQIHQYFREARSVLADVLIPLKENN